MMRSHPQDADYKVVVGGKSDKTIIKKTAMMGSDEREVLLTFLLHGDSEIHKIRRGARDDDLTLILDVLTRHYASTTTLDTFPPEHLLSFFTSVLSIIHHDVPRMVTLLSASNQTTHCSSQLSQSVVPPACERILDQFIQYFAPVSKYLEVETHFMKLKPVCVHLIKQVSQFLSLIYKQQETTNLDFESQSPLLIHPTVETRVQQVLKCLRILSRTDEFVMIMGTSRIDIIEILSHIMRLNPNSSKIQMECTAILANIASLPKNRAEILRSGCLSIVLSNMKTFIDQPEIELEICAALANFAIFERGATYIVQHDGLLILHQILKKYIDRPDLQTQGYNLLSHLTREQQAPNRNIQDLLISVIRESMSLHNSQAELMTGACNALGSLALSKYNFGSAKFEITKLVLDAMRRFEGNAVFYITACFAVAHMSFSHNIQKDLILSNGCLGMILEAMRRFPSNRALQTTGCFALGSILAMGVEYKESFLTLNGIPCILGAMTRKYAPTKAELNRRMGSSKRAISSFHISENSEGSNDGNSATPSETQLNSIENQVQAMDVDTTDTDAAEEPELELQIMTNPDVNPLVPRNEDAEDNEQQPQDIPALQGGKNQSLANGLLLQMFAAVALMNMADHEPSKKEMLRLGVLHYLFQAAKQAENAPELSFVVFTIFCRFSGLLDASSYIEPDYKQHVDSLVNIAARAYIDQQFELLVRPKLDDMMTAMDGEHGSSSSGGALASIGQSLRRYSLPLLGRLLSLGGEADQNSESADPMLEDADTLNSESLYVSSPFGRHTTTTRTSPRAKQPRLDQQLIHQIQSDTTLPQSIKAPLLNYRLCDGCQMRPSFHLRALRFYELNLKHCVSKWYCSRECAQICDEKLKRGDRHVQVVQIPAEELLRN